MEVKVIIGYALAFVAVMLGIIAWFTYPKVRHRRDADEDFETPAWREAYCKHLKWKAGSLFAAMSLCCYLSFFLFGLKGILVSAMICGMSVPLILNSILKRL